MPWMVEAYAHGPSVLDNFSVAAKIIYWNLVPVNKSLSYLLGYTSLLDPISRVIRGFPSCTAMHELVIEVPDDYSL